MNGTTQIASDGIANTSPSHPKRTLNCGGSGTLQLQKWFKTSSLVKKSCKFPVLIKCNKAARSPNDGKRNFWDGDPHMALSVRMSTIRLHFCAVFGMRKARALDCIPPGALSKRPSDYNLRAIAYNARSLEWASNLIKFRWRQCIPHRTQRLLPQVPVMPSQYPQTMAMALVEG